MGVTELAANLFRATQTDEKLRRDNITGKDKANQTHYDLGKKVRHTLNDLGGTMPEDFPILYHFLMCDFFINISSNFVN